MSRINVLAVSSVLIACLAFSHIPSGYGQSSIPTPESHFGFVPGADRMLFNYEELIDYLMKVDKASPMLKMVEIGKSPMGKPMYIAFISSEKNINNLDKLKVINRELALNPDLSEAKRKECLTDGKVFFLATLSMHSSEVAPSQAAPLIAYQLVTTNDPLIRQYLDNVVYMMVPNHNPDGMDFVVENYKKYKDTQYEGASLPRVYHKYVGHDNNRDFVGLTQDDTRAIARIYNLDWFPQVMIEKHQMGTTGIRYYVPPVYDPIAENIDAELWAWTGVFGTNMLRDLTNTGLSGVGQRTMYDDYWPGSTETCIWKNVIGMLTEAASVKDATPVYVEPGELQGGGKGLAEYEKSINFPLPWPGGWWRLNDIVNLEIGSTLSIIKTASLHKNDILAFRNDLCKREVEKGKTQPPFYYVIPQQQADQSELINLAALMKEQGITTYQLTQDYTLNDINLKAGDIVYPLAQPFRPFIKEVMEKQQYPERHFTPGGELVRPYDVTSWCLPLQRGLVSHEVMIRDNNFESKLKMIESYDPLQGSYTLPAIFPATSNGSFKAALMALQGGLTVDRITQDLIIGGRQVSKGSYLLQGKDNALLARIVKEAKTEPLSGGSVDRQMLSPVKIPRIALVETYFSDTDAGWTRFLFDTYQLPYTILHPDDFEKTDFVKDFDMVIFPSSNKNLLMNGKPGAEGSQYMGNYPPEYLKGMGKAGFNKLLQYINQGGKVIAWGESTDLFTGLLELTQGEAKEEFTLPYNNVADQARTQGLFIPGSLMRVVLKADHPLTWGMLPEVGIFYRGRPLFTTSVPRFDMDRRVIASFPEKDIFMSGYVEKEETLSNKAAMIWLKKGKGQLVLFAFQPQFRASTQADYKLLFNAILLPPAEE
jgi:hypothetical protein